MRNHLSVTMNSAECLHEKERKETQVLPNAYLGEGVAGVSISDECKRLPHVFGEPQWVDVGAVIKMKNGFDY